MGTRSGYVEVGDGRYFVRERGQGRALLLLHGFLGGGEDFLPFFRELSRTHRVLAVDLPGHGRTSVPCRSERFLVERVVMDLRQVCAAMGAEAPVVVGYSMGGRIALSCAVLEPDWLSGMVLESASPGLEHVDQREARRLSDAGLAERLQTKDLPGFLTDWGRQPLFATQAALPASARRRQDRVRQAQDPRGLALSLLGTGTGSQPSWWPFLRDVRIPTLLIAGGKDVKFATTAKAMASALPRARQEIVASAGHNVHLECPDRWVALVQSFLSELCVS
ncbi:MAG: 2-succinyl-6-hydroxy-2,4-cyclohexadiene-1-carboxylate synthase [Firmicutes bacterium]|nr:2-succinyl-6-hydroxy-2,4-cyclohexadiene-1-carboxylate synthase [Bacillota bacterium]